MTRLTSADHLVIKQLATGMSCWYLGSMDYFTPIKVGWIRPGCVGEISPNLRSLVTITSMDTLVTNESSIENATM